MPDQKQKEPTEQEVLAYRHAFELFDTNGDGTISVKELSSVMKSLGQNPSDAEIEDMINEVDHDRNGTIDFEEFVKMMTAPTKDVDFEAEMKSAFKVFDHDGSGTISSQEIRRVMTSFGENLTEEELDSMLKEVDKNGDGSIDYEEFVHFITKG
ncbi:calmodulin [Phlyctema vagabunda]|uniref:Calmodulin n=1 Tax=Phlyctema vagabunda TaxID=108571 RepID=A0ABR4P3V0_9HELO